MTSYRVDPEALILVQRNWTIYHTTWESVEAGLLDDEDLVLIQRIDKLYHMRIGDYRTGAVSLGEYDLVWVNLETQDRNEFAPSLKHFYFPWAQLRGLEFTLSADGDLPNPPGQYEIGNKLEVYLQNIRKSWDGFDPQLVCPGNRIIPLKANLGGNSRVIIAKDDARFLPGKYMLVGQFDSVEFNSSSNLTSVDIEEDIWNMMFWWYADTQTDRRPHDPSTYGEGLGEKMFRYCNNLQEISGAKGDKNIRIKTGNNMFDGCEEFDADISGLDIAAGDYSTAYRMLHGCRKFNNGGESMNSLGVEGVKTLHGMFYNCLEFNQDVSGWDVSKCENLCQIFSGCKAFNQNVGGWNVKNVTNMVESFRECSVFDQDLGAWDVGNVTEMGGMFSYHYSTGFNNGGSDSIKNWDTGKVRNFDYMFSDGPFNQPIGSWDTGAHQNYDSFYEMFRYCEDFDQDLTNWCVNRVTQVPEDFAVGTPIEGDLSKLPVWGTCP
jgi:surface protein